MLKQSLFVLVAAGLISIAAPIREGSGQFHRSIPLNGTRSASRSARSG